MDNNLFTTIEKANKMVTVITETVDQYQTNSLERIALALEVIAMELSIMRRTKP